MPKYNLERERIITAQRFSWGWFLQCLETLWRHCFPKQRWVSSVLWRSEMPVTSLIPAVIFAAFMRKFDVGDGERVLDIHDARLWDRYATSDPGPLSEFHGRHYEEFKEHRHQLWRAKSWIKDGRQETLNELSALTAARETEDRSMFKNIWSVSPEERQRSREQLDKILELRKQIDDRDEESMIAIIRHSHLLEL